MLVYGWPPKSARQYDENGNRIVWAVPKALYGGKASGRYWYNHLRKWLIAQGFIQSDWDPCVFTRGDHYIGIYVDDVVHVFNDKAKYDELIRKCKQEFHGYEDLGPLCEMFNAEVTQTPAHITITQTRFIETLCEVHNIDVSSKAYVPALLDLPELVRLAKKVDAAVDRLNEEDHREYRAIVGAILYISTVCRPDVSLAICYLSRCLESPTQDALVAARRVLRYLHTTKYLGIRYTIGAVANVHGMVDSDWAVDKSTSGYVFFLADAVFAWLAKGQPCIAMSSTEAEIMAASLAALEAFFVRGLLSSLGHKFTKPTIIILSSTLTTPAPWRWPTITSPTARRSTSSVATSRSVSLLRQVSSRLNTFLLRTMSPTSSLSHSVGHGLRSCAGSSLTIPDL